MLANTRKFVAWWPRHRGRAAPGNAPPPASSHPVPLHLKGAAPKEVMRIERSSNTCRYGRPAKEAIMTTSHGFGNSARLTVLAAVVLVAAGYLALSTFPHQVVAQVILPEILMITPRPSPLHRARTPP